MKWAVKKSLDATGGHVFCRMSEAVLSCCNGLLEMKRLILDENPVAIVYLQRSEDLQARPRGPEERLTEDRARGIRSHDPCEPAFRRGEGVRHRMKSPIPKATSSTLCKNRGTTVAGPSRGPAAARHDSGFSVRALQAPRVSVLLPVWNGEAFLEQAMESILRQTLSSFELIVIDDGSTDRTAAIAEEFASRDTRVRVLRRLHEGFSATLNAGIEAARGEYVARMDADDISLPDRLRKQVAYLDIHPACVAVGAWIEVVDEAGRHIGLKTFAKTHNEISAALLCGSSPMAHPTVVFRRDVVRAAGGYDARRYPSEDLDLWFRLGERGELANLGEALLQHRRHKAAMGVREYEKMKAMTLTICNQARAQHGLRPRHGTPILAGTNADAQYHFECARTALIAGPRLTAVRYAAATIAAEPDRLYSYAALFACAVPRPLLRFLLNLRARYR